MEKGEVIPDNTAPKSYLRLFVENYYCVPQYDFGDQTVKAEKNSQQKGSSLASWTAGKCFKQASQEIKVKLNESRQLKLYQVKQLKENSTREFCWKNNFTEDSKLNENCNISTKLKRKKILKF